MSIEIRQGADWTEVWLHEEKFSEGHRLYAKDVARLLGRLGFPTTMPDGGFCGVCGDWFEALANKDADAECVECAAYVEDDDVAGV